jgi:heat shock protein HslJ
MNARSLLLCAIGAAGALTMLSGCTTPPTAEATQVPAVPLVDTHWRLTQLGGTDVDNPAGEGDVHMVLEAQNTVVTGHSGCNRMFGRYALNGDGLKFDQMGGTRMFCEARMDLEQKFLAMFATVARWNIVGRKLELRDANGAVVAVFEFTPATG